MAYFVFKKDLNGVNGTLYRIAENQSDLDNLIINKPDYKIIEDSQDNFDAVKYGTKTVLNYNENTINYIEIPIIYRDQGSLYGYINNVKKEIKWFLDLNKNHSLYNKWNDYFNQLDSFSNELSNINFPLNKSLEQYFKDQNKPSLNPLQIP
jgi:hypothetical protein